MRYALAFLVASAAVGSGGVRAADFECSVAALNDAHGAPAQIQLPTEGKPRVLPQQLPACEGTKVLGGSAVVCALDRRSRLKCRTLKAGDTISAATLGRQTFLGGWILGFADILSGSPKPTAAVSRGTAPVDLPAGPVLLIDDRMILDFSAPGLAGVQAVEIREGAADGALIVQQAAVTGRAVIDTRRLVRGKTYWWALHRPGQTGGAVGNFIPLDGPTLASARQARQDIAGEAGNDPPAAAMMLAHWLWEQELAYDAAQVLLANGLTDAGPAVATQR